MTMAEDFDKFAKDIVINKFLKKDVCLKESYNNWQILLGFIISHLNWFEKIKSNGNKIFWDEKLVMRGTIETFSDFPVTTEDKCTICGKYFTFSDLNNISCYKPWIRGGFWHIRCKKEKKINE